MQDITEAEARALLSRPLICEDAPDWEPLRNPVGTYRVECGLVDDMGARSGLHVQLLVHIGQKTGLRTFKFSVFKISLGSPQRIYQLHVRQSPKLHANLHDRPHEHIGDLRNQGEDDWIKWGYAQTLERFILSTGITFLPAIVDPEIFKLT